MFQIFTSRQGAAPGGRPYVHEVHGGALAMDVMSSVRWPFRRYVTPPDPGGSVFGIHIPDLHRAFPAGQTAGTRLVLTQASYQLQRWLDWLDAYPRFAVIADMTAAPPPLAREAWSRRGPWSRIDVQEAPPGGDALDDVDPLLLAFLQPDPHQRLATIEIASDADIGNPALHLARASVLMELQRLDAAHDVLEQARMLADDWEAVHFELGKLWLRREETERAVEAFAEAGRLMPSFAAAFGNLGAALGELERPEDAIVALRQALTYDPNGHPLLNNLGVASRDLGDLEAAETAFRAVIDLAPDFVFGYYNLGHTLFLQGRFADARTAYEQGLEKDPQRNARQAARTAVARAAAGDAAGAIALIDDVIEAVPLESREDLLLEAESTLEALEAVAGDSGRGVAPMLARVRTLLENTKGAP